MIGCSISVVKSAYEIIPTLIGFMLLRSVILALFILSHDHEYSKLSGKTAGVTTGTGISE